MSERPIPLCPMGHEMELIQVAAGGWRYVCTRCATSFKAKKSTSCGWLSPIKSTKERAHEAATKRPLQKPLTLEELTALPEVVYLECTFFLRIFAVLPRSISYGSSPTINLQMVDVCEKFRIDKYGKTWRCWASHPTDEERAAVAWED